MKFYKNNTSTGAVTSHLLAATETAVYVWTGSRGLRWGPASPPGLGLSELPDKRNGRHHHGQRHGCDEEVGRHNLWESWRYAASGKVNFYPR
jgi:hypothetical protein